MSFECSPLEDVAEVVDSLHKTPNYSDAGFPMVRVTDVKYGTLNVSKTLVVDEATYIEFSRRYKPAAGDIVITRVGTYGVTARVTETMFCLGQNTAAIIPKSINSRYLYAALNSEIVRTQVEAGVVGSTQKTLSLKHIKALLIPRLGLAEEAEVAEIVGAIDDRITLLRETNATLEGIAQALFKSWFVDFDPVRAKTEGREPEGMDETTAGLFPDGFEESKLGMVPRGWSATTIGDQLKTVLGGTPSRARPEFWSNGSVAWVNSGKTNEYRIIEPSELITEEALRKSATKIMPKRTTLLAITGATLGQVSVNEIECCANQSVVGILASDKFPTEFVYFWVRQNIDKLMASQTGGAQQHINKGNVEELVLLNPSSHVLNAYLDLIGPIFDNIALNCFRAKALNTLRDTLLPRLISGQLRIPEVTEELMALAA